MKRKRKQWVRKAPEDVKVDWYCPSCGVHTYTRPDTNSTPLCFKCNDAVMEYANTEVR